jgi:hypothetical protein
MLQMVRRAAPDPLGGNGGLLGLRRFEIARDEHLEVLVGAGYVSADE